jgi:hypothetical protein
MSLILPRGCRHRKAALTCARISSNPPASMRETSSVHAFALGWHGHAVVRGPGAGESSRYLAGLVER